MKLLRLLALILIGTYFCVAAEQQPYQHSEKASLKQVFPQDLIIAKHQKDAMQALNIAIVDSLASCYAYFGTNNAYMYEPTTGSLVFIRRGFVDLLKNPGFSGIDEKNNLFIKYSKDWGKTWGESINVYNEKSYKPADKMDQARFPSIAPYVSNGQVAFAFTAPFVVETKGNWTGFCTGYWSEYEQSAFAVRNDSTFKSNGKVYQWGTQSKLACRTYGAESKLNVIAAEGVSSFAKDLADANNIAFRITDDNFEAAVCTIPPTWANSVFDSSIKITAVGSRINGVIGLKYGKTNLYMATLGFFTKGDVAQTRTVAFSSSSDEGKTWSEFDIFPYSMARAYATAHGANPDSSSFPWTTNDFTVLDNGDISIVTAFIEGGTSKPYLNTMRHIVEVYKEGGAWGIRKISDIYGSNMVFWDYWLTDATGKQYRGNPNDFELQIARTPDGKNVFAKWVDLIGVRDTVIQGQTQTTYKTTDIFCASREVGKSAWSVPKNATQSDLKDRTTMIPDYIPNGLLGIPFLSTASIINPDYTAQNQSLQTDSCGIPQYIILQIYDHSVGVENQSENISALDLLGIYPNPATSVSNIDFTLNTDANVDISIYNLVGQRVMQVYSGFQTMGMHSVNFNVSNIPSGTYNCTINQNGFTKSKLINIIR